MSAAGIAVRLAAGLAACAAPLLPSRLTAAGIPAFARKYRTSCSTCHTAAPKLNVLGEAFRLNGYRMPENDVLLRREEPVALGEDPWRDLWPRAIWPGEVPGASPLALRIQLDAYVTRQAGTPYTSSFRFPHEVYLLAGATLGDGIATFVEAEWSRESSLQVVQAKLKFQDVLPWLPRRAFNLWVGLQNLFLFTFADRQTDRAARQMFRWQEFRAADLALSDPATGDSLRSADSFQLTRPQPALSINGIVSRRFSYSLGLAQGGSATTTDNNNHRDFYYTVRYKLGGLRLDGTYPGGRGPLPEGRGQLLDRSLTFEHFGYFGSEPVSGGGDSHRTFGASARALHGPLDVGVGYVWGRNRSPWGSSLSGELERHSIFGKAEYLALPWLAASFKVEAFDTRSPAAARAAGFTRGGADETRLMPGLVILVRQNIRAVVEGELFTRHQPSEDRSERRPHALWLRLDTAF